MGNIAILNKPLVRGIVLAIITILMVSLVSLVCSYISQINKPLW